MEDNCNGTTLTWSVILSVLLVMIGAGLLIANDDMYPVCRVVSNFTSKCYQNKGETILEVFATVELNNGITSQAFMVCGTVSSCSASLCPEIPSLQGNKRTYRCEPSSKVMRILVIIPRIQVCGWVFIAFGFYALTVALITSGAIVINRINSQNTLT